MTPFGKAILTIVLIGFFMFLWAVWVQAGPYLMCDPTNDDVTECEIEVNGVAIPGTLEDLGDQIRIKHDLTGTPDGSYTFRARFGNVWDQWSDWSDPLDGTKAVPSRASGLGIEK